jgi:flagella basal body P-ring formation protein FlgA
VIRWMFLFIFSISASAEEMVRVKSHIVVAPTSNVSLAQLLDLSGTSAEFLKSVQAISLTVAPDKGERIEISGSAVTSLLRDVVAAEKIRSAGNVRILVPSQIVVDTVKRTIDEKMVREELLQAWKPLCSDCELEIRNLSIPKVENIVDWSLKLKAELPKGSFAIPVEITREGAAPLQAWINGQTRVQRKIPVAKRLMNIGERITSADVALESVDVTYSIDGTPTLEELVGKKLRRAVRAADPIWSSYIEREVALHRGESVRVSSAEGIWEVSMNAIADKDAFVGDTVSLKNPRTNKILTGVVVAQGEVELK